MTPLLPNFLSFLRIPLAFLFIYNNFVSRILTLLLAMLTDFFDGRVARRLNLVSKTGTSLDPITDKFFVFVVLSCFLFEEQITLWQIAMMLCRDFSVFCFGLYLMLSGRFRNYTFRAIYCGKITTTLQFLVLLLLTFKIPLPSYIYIIFLILGVAALGELYINREDGILPKKHIRKSSVMPKYSD